MNYYELIKILLDGGSFFLAIAAIIIAFFRTRQSKMDERLKAGSDRMDQHEGRIKDLENQVRQMPTKDDFHALDKSVQHFGSIMEANQERMASIGAALTRIEDYLLKAKG
ncbi:DUF2730 family protein [Tropicibacter sp. S64]|uniref:DUF2730 family protein n=1 Tax=Tropicibacter sp. S64 TaxID=3415122 RepID=UPI003C7DDC28